MRCQTLEGKAKICVSWLREPLYFKVEIKKWVFTFLKQLIFPFQQLELCVSQRIYTICISLSFFNFTKTKISLFKSLLLLLFIREKKKKVKIISFQIQNYPWLVCMVATLKQTAVFWVKWHCHRCQDQQGRYAKDCEDFMSLLPSQTGMLYLSSGQLAGSPLITPFY